MNIEELNEKEIEEQESLLLQKADAFWITINGRKEGSNVDKLRLLAREGRIQDKFQHDLMTNYYRKQGLWRDGRTTFEEREKQLILKKQEFGMKIAGVRDSKIKNIDTIIQKAQVKREALKKIPIQLAEEFKIDKNKILEGLQTELDNLYQTSKAWIDSEITNIYTEFINTTKNKQNQLIEKAKQDLEDLQAKQKIRMKNEVESFSAELEAELTVLDYIENDNAQINTYNEEIKKINQELNELQVPKSIKTEEFIEEPMSIEIKEEQPLIGLDSLTVAQLKDIADSNGIEYDAKIRKADLIELISK